MNVASDPRLCQGDRPHEWIVSSGMRCMICGVTPDEVERRFRDWRYESLVEKLTEAITNLTDEVHSWRQT